MTDEVLSCAAELWLSDQGTWVFLTVTPEVDEEIKLLAGPRSGFGSVRVEATIGATTWRTSVFPASEGFVLPVKKAVRDAEAIDVGDAVEVSLRLL